MSDFEIVEGEYPRLPDLLLEKAPGFRGSDEYAGLRARDRELPSVVAGAFMRYVERLHGEAGAAEPALAETYRAMERLAASRDSEVQNALIVDVFEHLDLPEEALNRFVSRLGPAARASYDRWIDPMGLRSR